MAKKAYTLTDDEKKKRSDRMRKINEARAGKSAAGYAPDRKPPQPPKPPDFDPKARAREIAADHEGEGGGEREDQGDILDWLGI